MTRLYSKAGFFVLALTSLANTIYGQINSTSGGRSIGMAETAILLEDQFGLFNNPGATKTEQLALLLSYNNRYLGLGINEAQVGLVMPIAGFTTGAGVSYYGDQLYNQLVVSSAIGHKVGFARLGIRGSYQQFYLEGYGYKRAFSIDLGGLFELSSQIKLAMQINNLTRSKLPNEDNYRLSSLLSLGFSYKPIESFRLDIQLNKDINQPVSGSLGMEYQLNQHITARTGFNFTNAIAALGFGFRWSQFMLDLAGNYQPRLGYSTVLSIIITRKNAG